MAFANTRTTVLDGNANVAFITPSGAPGVADDPVVETRVGIVAPTDHSNGVVNIALAPLIVENTLLVIAEEWAAGRDTDRSGTGIFKVALNLVSSPVTVHTTVVLRRDGSLLAFVECTSTILSRVRVVTLLHHVGLVQIIVEHIGGVATVATVVVTSRATGTINQLLFGQAVKMTLLGTISAFKLGISGEGPAATALTLVLDWVDTTLKAPVNTSCRSNDVIGLTGRRIAGINIR